jgi:hypothetical protein
MTRPIRVTAIYNKEPDIRRYVLALMELARQLHAEEKSTSTESRRDTQEPASDA